MKSFIVFVFLGLIAITLAARPHAEFAQFMRKYGKVYSSNEEFQSRFQIFSNNLNIIEKLNQEANGKATYGITEFADLSQEEFSRMHGYVPSSSNSKGSAANPEPIQKLEGTALPATWDWRNQGAVTPVKNQGQCGSCWAFSAVEGSESAWFLAGHTLTTLSTQEVVSCDNKCEGCNGCDLPEAFAYIEQSGLESDSAYPYTSGTTEQNGVCKYSSSDVVAYISSWSYATKTKNESEMQVNMYQYGPLSICVDAETWQFYKGGIITSNCGTRLDHCVQAVGWNQQSSTPYWIVRNSWGVTWGNQGYIYVEMFKDLCGIAQEATYVIGKK